MENVYRVGLLGFGFIGKVHAHAYATLPYHYDPPPLRARITHVCTTRQETAERGRALVGAEHAVTGFRAVTENPDVDIVHICTPNTEHQAALLSAMAHGKHIYCDKPLVAQLDETTAIREALSGYAGTAQMTLQCRFFPALMRARQLLDEGFLGTPLGFRAAFLHAGSANPDAPLRWKLTPENGGVIADLGSHVLDLVHWLLGDFESLCALTKVAYHDRPSAADPSVRVPVLAEDSVALLARMRSGATGTIEATKVATGTEDELRLEVHGSAGALRFNSMEPHFLDAFDATAPDSPIGGRAGWTRIATGQRFPAPAAAFPSPKNSLGWLRVHGACLANFLYDVAAGRPGSPGLAQGIRIQELLDCVRRSARDGGWATC